MTVRTEFAPAHLNQAWIKARTPSWEWRRALLRHRLGVFLRRILPFKPKCVICQHSGGGSVPPDQRLLWQIPTF